MGQEATCTLRFEGRTQQGRALLEHDALIFRGSTRLTIPFQEIRTVAARAGTLRVAFRRGVAAFRLGPAAERWAERIRSPKSLIDKLGITPGARVAVLGVTDAPFWAQLRARTRDISMARPRPGTDVIMLQVSSPRDLTRLRSLQGRITREGAIWVVAPKGASAVREADVLTGGKAAGLVDVKVAAFSSTHTAHKFVIPLARR
ncbi:MAG: DUF3052 family protein [Armatimonadetes bacterium]|nr:DUF3052 family protein [Armatimonadota bacterium]